MQPAPLAGTATLLELEPHHFGADATRTPRGDGNLDIQASTISVWLDATRTPRGDGNIHLRQKLKLVYTGMQPAPLTGTATFAFSTSTLLQVDATRTPNGDGN